MSIPRRLKTCKKCLKPNYLFSGGLCLTCYRKELKPIKKVGEKQAKKLRVYEKEKGIFFKEVTVCQFPGCESEYQTLHHGKGRIGDNLTNREFFRNLCPVHHPWAEEHPEEAKALGLSLDRLTN